MTLKEPVPFIQMATENQTVEVRVIIMLAIKDAHTQLDMLQRIIGFLQDPETVSTLLSYSAEQKRTSYNCYHIFILFRRLLCYIFCRDLLI
ncbi:PTS sugar transporter subunit IIA [Streptococcus iniae]